MQPIQIFTKTCVGVLFFIAFAGSIHLHAASLFGDHTCARWATLSEADQKAWANAFIAPLSLTFKGLRKSNVDKYNDNPNASLQATESINAYCKAHPDQTAAHGAAAYLSQLINN
ncbi:hypothetical protein [Limnohabitans sp. B9-3]|uniref:hypothetical protein n=1 Tax=Limnohabitans sp. B9-3 TaxID=1100707 RepID=UPI00117B63CE|nr:hypothetical protein [Limnohabitans sp. B9-3]